MTLFNMNLPKNMKRAQVFIFVLLIVGIRGFIVPDGLKTVSSPVGNITGFSSISDNGKFRLNKFLGIPYAESPTGVRRFAKPIPKTKFTSAFDATQFGDACLQLDVIFKHPTVKRSEDCLVLNIYSPENASSDALNKYAVMIFIHGGGFTIGQGSQYEADVLAVIGEVIVVTINYRLAELAFMTTGDSSMPGNLGLWDQHLAIKWVHDNIYSFGGDENRITIFGESAGSASVIYQSIYPGNKGLFQRAIAESGSANSPWAYMHIDEAANQTRKFSRAIGCLSYNSNELVACLKTKSATQFNTTMNNLASNGLSSWPPVVDNDFVLDTPNNIISGKSKVLKAIDMLKSIDLMIGVNSKEGFLDIPTMAFFEKVSRQNFSTLSRKVVEKSLLPHYLETYFKMDTPDIVLDAAVFEYTDWNDPENGIRRTQNIIDLVSETWFFVPTIQTANLHSTNNNINSSTFMYKMSYRPTPHFMPVPADLDSPTTVNHADELLFLFPSLSLDDNKRVVDSLDDIHMTLLLTWSNFAKSGNPNHPTDVSNLINATWPQYGSAENFLEISPIMTSKSVQQRLAPKAFDFWTNLLPAIIQTAMAHSAQPIVDPAGLIVG